MRGDRGRFPGADGGAACRGGVDGRSVDIVGYFNFRQRGSIDRDVCFVDSRCCLEVRD